MSANLNGIRSAARKGFFEWFLAQDIDVLCVQETKAQEHQLGEGIIGHAGYATYFLDAKKPGYSGVALYTRSIPDRVTYGIGLDELDAEGRYIQADYGDLSIASLYAPSGTSGAARQDQKELFLERLAIVFKKMQKSGRRYIVCGDLNIAHKPVDLKNWRANQRSSGFLPHERAWLDTLFDEIGMIDAFRVIDQRPEQFTWWSARANARANNVGWRIDYHVVTENLKATIRTATIDREPFFSDHAPLTIGYEL